jgi:hypothetical protein
VLSWEEQKNTWQVVCQFEARNASLDKKAHTTFSNNPLFAFVRRPIFRRKNQFAEYIKKANHTTPALFAARGAAAAACH